MKIQIGKVNYSIDNLVADHKNFLAQQKPFGQCGWSKGLSKSLFLNCACAS